MRTQKQVVVGPRSYHRTVCPVPALPAAVMMVAGLSLVLAPGCATRQDGNAAGRTVGTPVVVKVPGAIAPSAAGKSETGTVAATTPDVQGGTPSFRWTLDRLADAENGAVDGTTRTEQRERRSVTSASATSSESMAYADVADSLTQVTFTTAGNDFDPVVSRDGKTIVFASTQHRPSPDLYLARVGSRAITQLTTDPASDAMPAISPDGRMIAFASDRSGSWQVYVMPAAGGRAVAMTDDAAPAMHPTFSADGTRVAFSRLGQMTGRWELWVAPVATPAQAEFIGFGLKPAWCPVAGTGENGSDRIAFQRARERGDRAYSLWTIDYRPGDVGSPVQIVPADVAAAINPAWSPDGAFIAYASAPVKGGKPLVAGGAAGGLWITTSDGASRVNVSSGRDNALSPTWASTDRLFFVSNRAGRDQVWSVGTQRAIAALPGGGGMTGLAGQGVKPAREQASMVAPGAPGAGAGPGAVAGGAGAAAGAGADASKAPAVSEPSTVSVPSGETVQRDPAEPIATAPEVE